MAGRPKHQKTDALSKQAEQLSGLGLPQDQIARVLGMGERTLQKYYAAELSQGIAKMGAQIAGWAVDSARKGNVSMRIFLCKTRLGWRERDHYIADESKPIKLVFERGPTRKSQLIENKEDEDTGTE
jgi:hypothetical protein